MVEIVSGLTFNSFKTAIILSNPAPLIAWASIYKLELAKSIYNRLRPFLRPQ